MGYQKTTTIMEDNNKTRKDSLMRMTKHARDRAYERNVSLDDIVLAVSKPGKQCRQRANRTVHYLPKGKDVLVVMVADGEAITTVFWTKNTRRG